LGFYGTPTQNSVIWCQLGQEIGWTEWFEGASFKDEVPMYVAFAGEFGIDTGGPFREFCRLASEGLATSRIFWGPADYKNLQLSFDGSPAVYEAELPFY
jgi:hypothetical protein